MMYFARWKIAAILGGIVLAVLLAVPSFVPKERLGAAAEWLPWRQFQLGLDLKGGSYLLLEVDMDAVIRERLGNLADGVRTRLRGANIGYTGLAIGERSVTLKLVEPARAQEAVRLLRELASPVTVGLGQTQPDLEVAAADGTITLTLSEPLLRDKATQAVEQSIEIIRRRIDETGVVDPVIARQGANRVLVQLPGIQDPERIKQLIGTTARMTFHLLDETADLSARTPPPGVMFLEGDRGPGGQPTRYAVRRRVEVDGANLTDARAGQDSRTGEWVVNFTFDSVGTRRFAEVTRNNVGRPFAIVLDNRVITAPVIREPITGGRGQISGNFTAATAHDLAVLLRAGALPAPLTVIEERTVGPDLGADSIRAGAIALAIGFCLVIAWMALFYGLFGWFANLALIVNMILLLAVLSLMEATLTLPGIAGILLTLGMAVDANILINERIREEAKRGRTPMNAMEAGFKRAFATIIDSNLTTLLAMAMLYAFGSGPVRGFAVTISVGIVTSMFSAIVFVRMLMVQWYRVRRPAALPV
ncbi:protein translocase subunit SecD [Elioraea sp.]|uniref:protein translocase subunit SecD n=1 Tax=Elioraea sp. TaxID=2185103 RepID=UPI00307F2E03